jgi:hypothetical protein
MCFEPSCANLFGYLKTSVKRPITYKIHFLITVVSTVSPLKSSIEQILVSVTALPYYLLQKVKVTEGQYLLQEKQQGELSKHFVALSVRNQSFVQCSQDAV